MRVSTVAILMSFMGAVGMAATDQPFNHGGTPVPVKLQSFHVE